MAVLKRDLHQHTYADYLIWDEVIDGNAYIREPPSPSVVHQVIAVELWQQIEGALKGGPCRASVAPLDVRLPKTTDADDQTVKLAAYERASVREVWLVHPTDLTVAIYRVESGCYGRATILDLEGKTALTAVRDVVIDWDEVLAEVP